MSHRCTRIPASLRYQFPLAHGAQSAVPHGASSSNTKCPSSPGGVVHITTRKSLSEATIGSIASQRPRRSAIKPTSSIITSPVHPRAVAGFGAITFVRLNRPGACRTRNSNRCASNNSAKSSATSRDTPSTGIFSLCPDFPSTASTLMPLAFTRASVNAPISTWLSF